MENSHLDKFLHAKLSLNEMDLAQPGAELVFTARNKVGLRKQNTRESLGFFTSISRIFNLQIKLYQAALASLVIAGYIYFFTKTDVKPTQTVVTQYITDHSSVNSSTVLASIITFILE